MKKSVVRVQYVRYERREGRQGLERLAGDWRVPVSRQMLLVERTQTQRDT